MSLDQSEYMIDWIEFVETSIESGWKVKGTLLKIEQSFMDYYEKEFSDIIMNRLRDLYEDGE